MELVLHGPIRSDTIGSDPTLTGFSVRIARRMNATGQYNHNHQSSQGCSLSSPRRHSCLPPSPHFYGMVFGTATILNMEIAALPLHSRATKLQGRPLVRWAKRTNGPQRYRRQGTMVLKTVGRGVRLKIQNYLGHFVRWDTISIL
jgi:hypothetical protein